MNRSTVFAIFALALALIGPASAGTLFRMAPAAQSPKTLAGIISGNGGVHRGSGFTVDHPATGVYLVTFDQGLFPTGCASVVVESSPYMSDNLPVINDAFVSGCAAHKPVVHVYLVKAHDFSPIDLPFAFVAVGV